MSKKLVIIDAGHGGYDPGASGHGHVEKNETLKEALLLEKIFKNQYDVDVYLTRRKDEYVGINARRNKTNELARKYGVDNVVFISLHWNSHNSQAHGFEILVNYPNTKGDKLAKVMMDELIPILPLTNRGIKYQRGRIGVLRANPATVLVEACFISNKNDINRYLPHREEMLNAYAKGIAKYLNLKRKQVKPIKPTKLYKVQLGAYNDRSNADRLLKKLKANGFDGFIKLPASKDDYFRVQTGAYRERPNANRLLRQLEAKGFIGFIVVEEKERFPIMNNKKSKYIEIGNTKIIKTTPDNIYIPVLGDNLFRGGFYGINGTFFDTNTAPVSSPNSCVYIAVNNGKAISSNAQFNGWKAPARGTIYYTKDNKLGNRKVKSVKELPKNTDWAIGGATIKPYMDFKNEGIPSSITYKAAHTYIGYDDKGYIYLIVKPYHRPSEIVPVLDELRITQAIMLDGGGSSQFFYEDKKHYSSRKINTAVLIKTV